MKGLCNACLESSALHLALLRQVLYSIVSSSEDLTPSDFCFTECEKEVDGGAV